MMPTNGTARTSFRLTDVDLARAERIKAHHGYPTLVDALRHALRLADPEGPKPGRKKTSDISTKVS